MSNMYSLSPYVDILKTGVLWLRSSTSHSKHIFITGAPRSGTTLIKTVLTCHPAISGGNYESTGIFKARNLYQYSCGEMEKGLISVSCEEVTNVIDFYDHIAEAFLGLYGGHRFVDKIWPHRLRLQFVATKFPNASWIHMIRDGRDSYCSAQNHPNVPQSQSLEQYARYWERCNKLVERFVSAESKVVVRYEDLVSEPRAEIPRVMEFLKLSAVDDQFHPAKSGQLPSIHRQTWHRRLTQPLNSRSVGRNEKELRPDERSRFEMLAHEGLKKYGYL